MALEVYTASFSRAWRQLNLKFGTCPPGYSISWTNFQSVGWALIAMYDLKSSAGLLLQLEADLAHRLFWCLIFVLMCNRTVQCFYLLNLHNQITISNYLSIISEDDVNEGSFNNWCFFPCCLTSWSPLPIGGNSWPTLVGESFASTLASQSTIRLSLVPQHGGLLLFEVTFLLEA